MNLSLLTGDDKLFLSRLTDLHRVSREKYITRFTAFLNKRQQQIAAAYINQNRLDSFLFYGGYDDSERVILGFFAPHETPDHAGFPLVHITSKYPDAINISHRDFLGAIMALQITRQSIGDILTSPGRCDLFALGPVADIILNELNKVGSSGVKTAIGVPGDFVVLARFETIKSTISSVRIDCLVSMLTRLSRQKAAELIICGKVERNYFPVQNASQDFELCDTIVIRGYGKYIVDEIGSLTKKGRLPVICRKYI